MTSVVGRHTECLRQKNYCDGDESGSDSDYLGGKNGAVRACFVVYLLKDLTDDAACSPLEETVWTEVHLCSALM